MNQPLVRLIEERLPPPNHPLHKAAFHHFSTSGKQLRGLAALDACKALQVARKPASAWACSIELLHNASLIHDDLCDEDPLRRGHPTVWNRFGPGIALCLGDWLIASAFASLGEDSVEPAKAGRLSAVLARSVATMAAGQVLDVHRGPYPNWQQYRVLAAGKTAPLFSAPFEGAAILAGQEHALTGINPFLERIGFAYQIANDINNFTRQKGKSSAGSDLLHRRPNAVVVCFRESLVNGTLHQFDTWLASEDIRGAAEWSERICQSDAIRHAQERLQHEIMERDIPLDPASQSLRRAVEPLRRYLLDRRADIGKAPVNGVSSGYHGTEKPTSWDGIMAAGPQPCL